jgi:hypothetical protein
MNAASKDIALNILDGESSLGLTYATDLFYSRLPADPAVCVSVQDNVGSGPTLSLKQSTSNYHYSSVNVQIRDIAYDSGYETAQKIVELLHGLHGQTISGTKYLLIRSLDDVGLLYYDENDRPVFSVNFEVQRVPV